MCGSKKTTLPISLIILLGVAGCNGINQAQPQTLKKQALERLQDSGNSNDPLLTMRAVETSVELRLAKAPEVCIQVLSASAAPLRFAGALGLVQLPVPAAEEPLKKLLSDPDESVRLAALGALHKLGKQESLQELIGALKSPDQKIRGNALTVLGRIGDKSAIEAIRPLFKSEPVESVRLQAAEALVLLGDQSPLPHLQLWQYSTDYQERAFAVQLMGRVEPPPDFTADLLQALNDPNELVQLQAAQSLGRLGQQAGFEKALRYLNPSSGIKRAVAEERGLGRDDLQLEIVISQIRSLAAQALGDSGRWEAAESLSKALDDKDPQVALAAAYGSLKLLIKTNQASVETVLPSRP